MLLLYLVSYPDSDFVVWCVLGYVCSIIPNNHAHRDGEEAFGASVVRSA